VSLSQIKQYFKISFCTVSMNRLIHLEKTFIKNILDNKDYPSVEFILLNYNSTDELDEWASQELTPFIKEKLVHYYKTSDPIYYDPSHSKNMAFRLATGDIICNVDADNFIGENFAFYINENMGEMTDNMLVTKKELENENDRNTYGRICVFRKHFLKVNGFDERMKGYGFEDIDFINRLRKSKVMEVNITEKQYLQSISHSKALRINEDEHYKNIKDILIHYLNHYTSEVILLYYNYTFEFATILDLSLMRSIDEGSIGKFSIAKYDLVFQKDQWGTGNWSQHKEQLILKFSETGLELKLDEQTKGDQHLFISVNEADFYCIKDINIQEDLLYIFPQMKNQVIMEQNAQSNTKVNLDGYGKGKVYHNLTNNLITLH